MWRQFWCKRTRSSSLWVSLEVIIAKQRFDLKTRNCCLLIIAKALACYIRPSGEHCKCACTSNLWRLWCRRSVQGNQTHDSLNPYKNPRKNRSWGAPSILTHWAWPGLIYLCAAWYIFMITYAFKRSLEWCWGFSTLISVASVQSHVVCTVLALCSQVLQPNYLWDHTTEYKQYISTAQVPSKHCSSLYSCFLVSLVLCARWHAGIVHTNV